jgi:hypothetical protein
MRVLVSFVGLVVLAACGSDSSTSPGGSSSPGSPVGAYALTTINAKALPASIISDPSYSIEITAGSLSLTSDGRYKSLTTTRETVAGHASLYLDSVMGTWTQTPAGSSTIVFTSDSTFGKTTQSGTFASGQVTVKQKADLTSDTLTIVYKK